MGCTIIFRGSISAFIFLNLEWKRSPEHAESEFKIDAPKSSFVFPVFEDQATRKGIIPCYRLSLLAKAVLGYHPLVYVWYRKDNFLIKLL
jgi:hypothetical protein